MPKYTVNWPLKMGGKIHEAGKTIAAEAEDVAHLVGGVLSGPPAAEPDDGPTPTENGLSEEQEKALREHLAADLAANLKSPPTVKDLVAVLKFPLKAADRDRVLDELKAG